MKKLGYLSLIAAAWLAWVPALRSDSASAGGASTTNSPTSDPTAPAPEAVDTDHDGLSDDDEVNRTGSDPAKKNTDDDDDGVEDPDDGWPRIKWLYPSRLPDVRYAVVKLRAMGLPSDVDVRQIDDSGNVLAYNKPRAGESMVSRAGGVYFSLTTASVKYPKVLAAAELDDEVFDLINFASCATYDGYDLSDGTLLLSDGMFLAPDGVVIGHQEFSEAWKATYTDNQGHSHTETAHGFKAATWSPSTEDINTMTLVPLTETDPVSSHPSEIIAQSRNGHRLLVEVGAVYWRQYMTLDGAVLGNPNQDYIWADMVNDAGIVAGYVDYNKFGVYEGSQATDLDFRPSVLTNGWPDENYPTVAIGVKTSTDGSPTSPVHWAYRKDANDWPSEDVKVMRPGASQPELLTITSGSVLANDRLEIIVGNELIRNGVIRPLTDYMPTGWSVGTFAPKAINVSGVILTDAIPPNSPSNAKPEPILLVPASIQVDANRDGVIDDKDLAANSASKPFRFWSNDDDDWGDTGTNSILTPGQDVSDIPGQGQSWSNASTNNHGADYSTDITGKGVVDGIADFVDFFPVYLDIKQLLTVLPPSSSIIYKLKQEDSALNFVYTKLTRADALKYQTEDKGSIFGDTLNQALKESATHQITNAGTDLSAYGQTFFNGIKNNDWGVILVEGRAATTKPLVLSVEKSDGTVIAEVKLEIKISSVEDMYRRLNFRDSNGQPPAGLLGDTSKRDEDLGKPTNMDEPANFPDSQTNGKWFVMVVGSNVGGQKMRGWESEVFKRMWWSKSKARFVGVSWYGDPYSDGNDLVYDYHSAARNAFATAPALAAALNALSGSKTVAGHSAAALIISSAVADHGLNAANTCLLDAAMARECFDGSSADDLVGMVPEVWRDYPAALWASRWSERFGAADARSSLTWRNRFSGATSLSTVHNFYSSTEEVLARYEGTVDHSIIENIRAPGSFAWVIQEKAKGDKLRIGWFIHAGSDYGGWGFNLNDPITSNLPTWYVPNNNTQRVTKTPGQIGSVTSQMLNDIKIQPLFKTGWGRYYYGNPSAELVDTDPAYYTGPSWILDLYGATSGNGIAADPVKRTQLLSEAIPATSLAVGANYTARFGDSKNYDMPNLYANAARWPSARGASAAGVPNWHHSDMREVAYIYLYPFFDKLGSLSNQ
jgi:hypothetical protein